MWNEEEMRSHEDQEEGADLGKKELVDGLIAAVSLALLPC